MFAAAFYTVLILAYIICVGDIRRWKQTILLRTAIGFCLNCFLWFFSVFFDDFSETAQGLMLFLLVVLMLVFAVAVFLKQRWKWQSALVFSIPFVTLIIIRCCGGYFIMS